MPPRLWALEEGEIAVQQTIRALMLGVAILALAVACGSFTMLRALKQTGGSGSEPVEVVLESGDSTNVIAARLREAGIIRQPLLFTLLVRAKDLDGKLQAGRYMLSPNMTMGEVMAALQSGQAEEVQITIIEGSRLEEIAETIEASGLAEREAFLATVRDGASFRDNHFLLQSLPDGASLEGYLFPDTYRVAATATVTEVVETMLDNFDRQYQSFETEVQVRGRSVHEIVTMASIVQREAALVPEMPRIAGVFWNRLEPAYAAETGGGRLQADPTVQYALGQPGEWWPRLEELPLEQIEGVDSPYNTRTVTGLPPGPISNPGLAALEAAAKPAVDPPYIYFVASCARDGSHRFAANFEEFQRFEAEFLACQ
jgi:UPF0755 protein